MRKIGLISDTHGYVDSGCLDFLSDVDEIWHAGDIGSEQVLDLLESKKPVKAVYGNIDDTNIRKRTKENLRFNCEGVDVWITHIGGYPGNYSLKIKNEIIKNPPRLFISGHSHILKIINDKKLGLLHINPGAAGNKGWHKFITAIRFIINGNQISDLQVFEKKRKT